MAKTKHKRTKTKRLTLIGFAFVVFAIIVLMSHHSEIDEKRSARLPFEELSSPSRQLLSCISLVDRSISDGLHKMGVPREKILFLSTQPAYKNDFQWDFSNIEVTIPYHYDIFRVGKEFRDYITNLRIPVQIAVNKKSRNEIIYSVYCKGFYTHRVTLTLESPHVFDRVPSPKIAIIIDDLGYDCAFAHAFLAVDLSLTLSILPFTPHTRSIARKSNKEGREIMLHLPMEPRSYPALNPGDGVLLVSMDKDMILDVLDKDIGEVPFVAGVNNHMGSKFTENEEKMIIVLTELKRRGLYFIDSRTSPNSVAFDLAKEMGIRAASRDIFLDNDLLESALSIQMDRLLTLAKHRGHAIGIAHPHKETLGILQKYQPILSNEAEVVPVSDLLNY